MGIGVLEEVSAERPPDGREPYNLALGGVLHHILNSLREGPILASLSSFIALGLPAGALGAAWPSMRASFGSPLAGLGLLLALSTTGYFIAGGLAGWLMQRRSITQLFVGEAVVTGAGLVLLAETSEWRSAILANVLIGLGSGALNATINASSAVRGGPGRIGALHALWALGAAIGPVVVLGSLGLTGSWRPAYLWMAAVFLTVAAAVYWRRRGWVRYNPPVGPSTIGSTRYKRVVMWTVPAFFYVGLEASVGQWSFTQLTGTAWLPNALIGGYVALFWLALMVGRMALALAGTTKRLEEFDRRSRFMDWSVIIAVMGTVGYLALPDESMAVAPLMAVGLGLSIVVPLQFKAALDRAAGDAKTAARLISSQCAAGTLGYALLPAAIGLGMQWFGLATLKPLLVLTGLGMIVAHFCARHYDRPTRDRLRSEGCELRDSPSYSAAAAPTLDGES
jgi:fucose permease